MEEIDLESQQQVVSPEAAEDVDRVATTLMKRTSLFVNNWQKNRRPTAVKKREHYRRGTVILNHLQTKLEKDPNPRQADLMLYEKMKKAHQTDVIGNRSMFGITVFSNNEVDDPFTVNNMPMEIQIGFRRKMYGIFACQLVVTTILMSILMYVGPIADLMFDTFRASLLNTAATFVVMMLALGALYTSKFSYPGNMISLVVFTLAESFSLSAVGFFLGTHAPVVISAFLVVVVSFMMFLTTYRFAGTEEDGEVVLMGHVRAGIYSYFIALAWSIVFHGLVHPISDGAFVGSVLFIFVLVLWFSYDASCMCRKMSPDEFMQSVIFFYTDMILFLLFIGIISISVFACEGEGICGGEDIIAAAPMDGGGAIGAEGAGHMALGVTHVDGHGIGNRRNNSD